MGTIRNAMKINNNVIWYDNIKKTSIMIPTFSKKDFDEIKPSFGKNSIFVGRYSRYFKGLDDLEKSLFY